LHTHKLLLLCWLRVQALQLNRPFSEVRLALEVMFEGTEGHGHMPVTSTVGGNEDEAAVRVAGLVTVIHKKADRARGGVEHVVVQWEGSSVADMVADAVVAVVLQVRFAPSVIVWLEMHVAV
jgi:cleavage and polyadenylation specificity factor subunit 3